MLGTAESCSSGALPQGAGAGATLGVVTELWPWAEKDWVVWDGGPGRRAARKLTSEPLRPLAFPWPGSGITIQNCGHHTLRVL